MATLTKGKTFTNGELVTPATLHSLVDSGTVTNIVNADISNTAAIADSKLAQISTAGKVLAAAVQGTLANARTTATSANTANAIVARDASGDFSAGKINGVTVGMGGGSQFTNTAVGYSSLFVNTSGSNNTAVGSHSLSANITGGYNTAIGGNALVNNTTGNTNTAIGAQALEVGNNFTNCSGVGHYAQVTGSNQVQLGKSTATTYAYGAVQDRSDVRDKADIRDTTLGLDFVNALRPVDFKWDMREDYRSEAPQAPDQDASQEAKVAYQTAKAKWLEDVKLANITRDGSKKRGRYHHGLIAQEVKSVLDSKGLDFGGYQDHSIKGGDDVLSIGYEELIAPMLKAIQELAARVAALEAR
jgi:hypothetical protein